MDDYAVVVGIARYPELSAEKAVANLDGPDNDAQDIYDWLVAPDGGALDPSHVKLIRSADFEPPDPDDPQPAEVKIEQALKWLEKQTRDSGGGRLYLYFSGHGFSPELEEAALFTAEASQVDPSHVYVHSWLRWFRKAQRFREAVVWMDCCMDFQRSVPVQEVPLRLQLGTSIPGPVFIGLAAHTRKALEREMADGKVHGVFTWTLLKGLNGGASDERGQVTAESLRTFLYAVMPEFIPEDAKKAGSIDMQPFVRADQDLVLRVLPERPKYTVQITVPAAATDQELHIWTGRPPRQVQTATVSGTTWSGELVRGLYVAELPGAGFRQGFQVSGAGDVKVEITERGAPVVPSDGSELFALHVDAANPAASVAVIDYQFNRIASATGVLQVRDMPGVYKVRVEIGRSAPTITDRVLLLDRETHVGDLESQLSSPAPIAGSVLTHESHTGPFMAIADRSVARDAPATRGAAISLMARYWTPSEAPAPAGESFPHPMSGLRLVNLAGRTVSRLAEDYAVDTRSVSDPVAVWERPLPPGPYVLRQTAPGRRVYESCVIACADWVTQVAIRRPGSDDEAALTAVVESRGDAAVFMRRPGADTDPEQDAAIEAARRGLSQGRDLFAEGRGQQLQELLLEKYEDPIAGIIGSHLLLRALATDPEPTLADRFDRSVTRLRDLVGRDHPDVEALSLRCSDKKLRTTAPFTVPPMFMHSWQLISAASYDNPELVPLSLWQRVHATANIGPLFVWSADKGTKDAHSAQLSEWIARYHGRAASRRGSAAPPALPKAAREDGRRMQLPVAAAMALWERRSS